jgi:hypothetical protein
MDTKKKKTGLSCGVPSRGTGTTSEPASEVSAKGRDEPVLRNLPDVTSRTVLLGVSSSDTPMQGASSLSIPAQGEGLRHLASGTGRLHLSRTEPSGCARQKLKKASASQAGTRSTQQVRNVGMSKLGETLTGTSKRPRSDGSNPVERARPSKRPKDSSGPGTYEYKEVLTNIKIAISKENYPEDKLTEDDQDQILKELGSVFHGTPKGTLPHLRSFRLEGDTFISAIDNHRLGSRTRLKAMNARNLPKPVKVALRTKDKVAKNPDELLKWIKNLSPGLHKEHWRVLDRQPEPKVQSLILFID